MRAGGSDDGEPQPPPASVWLGATSLALALALALASSPGELPVGPGIAGYAVFFRVAAHEQVGLYVRLAIVFPVFLAALLLGWRRLPAPHRL